MKIVVIGASGTIGKAVVQLLKEKGHEVVGASRSSEPSVDFTDSSSIDRFYETIGEVDAIVTAAGDAAFVALEKLDDAQIQLSLHSKLMGQINMVRKGLSKLRPNGAFVITGGILAYTPWPQTSMITMVNLGLEGFAKAAALDLTEGRRIVVVHPPWVAETATALGMDATPWPNAAKVAEAYLAAVEGNQNGVPVFVEGYDPTQAVQ
ncbi:short chain dehydrogenase [Segetibacter aerophilus]|uniref:Short chain dehydrogenase n=1 Tax=Segetibacter aerophilus TaxID=670293 RepID=A0A512B8V0_9BACT|nr:short chain dehydrogenase [Segetibacter aerophilus]GEO08386.1 short chain dehydrogenase [Segetibacter aerophilus]